MNQRAAKIWQAACLGMYASSIAVTDEFGSAEDKAAAREEYIDNIMSTISTALKPIFDHNNLDFTDKECARKLRDLIVQAVKIGDVLGELHSGLVLMDKAWFRRHAHEKGDEEGRVSPSLLGSRIDVKAEPDGRLMIKAKVAVILFPGLLKYGSDDGESWDSWSVWIPAKVQLMEIETEALPPPRPPPPPSLPPSLPPPHPDMQWEPAVSAQIANKKARFGSVSGGDQAPAWQNTQRAMPAELPEEDAAMAYGDSKYPINEQIQLGLGNQVSQQSRRQITQDRLGNQQLGSQRYPRYPSAPQDRLG